MSDIAGKMAEWRKTVWGAGPCPESQENFRLTDAEREAVEWCVEMALNSATDCVAEVRTLRGLLERIR